MRSLVICLFLVFCVHASGLYAQRGQILWTPQEILKKFSPRVLKPVLFKQYKTEVPFWLYFSSKQKILPRNFYTQTMGAICKMELKMQKQIKFPLFIRMGNKDYADALEGKHLPLR